MTMSCRIMVPQSSLRLILLLLFNFLFNQPNVLLYFIHFFLFHHENLDMLPKPHHCILDKYWLIIFLINRLIAQSVKSHKMVKHVAKPKLICSNVLFCSSQESTTQRDFIKYLKYLWKQKTLILNRLKSENVDIGH